MAMLAEPLRTKLRAVTGREKAMLFKNREHAARLLAQRLISYKGKNPLVLGIPRGATPMAKIIAEALGGELDVVLVHKLGAPDQPELAIGSVDETGRVYLADYVSELGVGEDYIQSDIENQLATLRRRRATYTPLRPPIDPSGRIVIVVDNGIATGATMIAALRATRAKKPAKLIGAVAVAPCETVARLRKEADEIVCLKTPADFNAVGQFFEDFSQVTDEDVVAILSGGGFERSAQR
jgi:putative phosphoribosyl transferase